MQRGGDTKDTQIQGYKNRDTKFKKIQKIHRYHDTDSNNTEDTGNKNIHRYTQRHNQCNKMLCIQMKKGFRI